MCLQILKELYSAASASVTVMLHISIAIAIRVLFVYSMVRETSPEFFCYSIWFFIVFENEYSCFFGTEIEALNCPCGNNPILFLREDVSKMEKIAKKFEQDKGIMREVHRYKDDKCLQKNETTLKVSKQQVKFQCFL